QDFTNQDLVGSYLSINGFTGAGFNSGAKAFPIVGQPSTTTVTVIAPDATGTETIADGTFAVINGAGPIPTAGGADATFLTDAGRSVRIQKAADPNWGAIDVTLFARGESFALDDDSARL